MTTTRALIAAEIARRHRQNNQIMPAPLQETTTFTGQATSWRPDPFINALEWVLTILPPDAPSPDRERVARIIDPGAFERRTRFLEAAEMWRNRVGPDHLQNTCDFMVSQNLKSAEYEIAPALAKADEILALTAAIPIEREGFVLVPVAPDYEHIRRLSNLWGYTIEEAAETYCTIIDEFAVAPVLSGRGETGWRPLDKEADFDTNGWLWAPPENIFSEPEGRDGVIYFGKPRNWTWATMIWPVVQPAPPAKPSGEPQPSTDPKQVRYTHGPNAASVGESDA